MFKVSKTTLWALVALCVITPELIRASAGDRLAEYSICTNNCNYERCHDESSSSKSTSHSSLPFLLRALFWTCFQDCQYRCQQLITAVRLSRGESILQFHGKWPFIRMWGMQEPASVLFSLMNLIPHAFGYIILNSRQQKDQKNDNVMAKYYRRFALVSVNTWVWSAVFHTRDFVVTERLDYFSAALTMMVSFFVCTVRMFKLDGDNKILLRRGLFVLCALLYLSHVGYLSLIKFSYSYNMAANVAVGVVQTLMWSVFSIREFIRTRRRSALAPLAIVWSITAASSLELFDFPPWWYIVDAHSLWHLATVLPTTWWYQWMVIDLDSTEIKSKPAGLKESASDSSSSSTTATSETATGLLTKRK